MFVFDFHPATNEFKKRLLRYLAGRLAPFARGQSYRFVQPSQCRITWTCSSSWNTCAQGVSSALKLVEITVLTKINWHGQYNPVVSRWWVLWLVLYLTFSTVFPMYTYPCLLDLCFSSWYYNRYIGQAVHKFGRILADFSWSSSPLNSADQREGPKTEPWSHPLVIMNYPRMLFRTAFL